MRILLANHAPLEGFGAGAQLNDLATALVKQGHEVRALIVDSQLRSGDPFSVHRIVCQADDPTADLNLDIPLFVPHANSSQLFTALGDDQLSAYREVLRRHLDDEIDHFDPQIVHVQHAWVLAELVLESGVPYVLTVHQAELDAYRQDARYRSLADQAIENAGRVLVGDRPLQTEVRRTFDTLEDRTQIMPAPVDIERFRPQGQDRAALLQTLGLPADCGPIVAMVSNLIPECGADVLLNAAARYEADDAKITTVIVGDGPQRQELELQARRLELDRVYFLGIQPRDRCGLLYQAAAVTMVAAGDGTLKYAALESLAAGAPVITLGQVSAARQECVISLAGGDHELLADAILHAVHNDSKAKCGSVAIDFIAANHHADRHAEQLTLLYREVFANRFGRI